MSQVLGIQGDTATFSIFVMLIVLGVMLQGWKFKQGGRVKREGKATSFIVSVGVAIMVAGLSLMWLRAVDNSIGNLLPPAVQVQSVVPDTK